MLKQYITPMLLLSMLGYSRAQSSSSLVKDTNTVTVKTVVFYPIGSVKPDTIRVIVQNQPESIK